MQAGGSWAQAKARLRGFLETDAAPASGWLGVASIFWPYLGLIALLYAGDVASTAWAFAHGGVEVDPLAWPLLALGGLGALAVAKAVLWMLLFGALWVVSLGGEAKWMAWTEWALGFIVLVSGYAVVSNIVLGYSGVDLAHLVLLSLLRGWWWVGAWLLGLGL